MMTTPRFALPPPLLSLIDEELEEGSAPLDASTLQRPAVGPAEPKLFGLPGARQPSPDDQPPRPWLRPLITGVIALLVGGAASGGLWLWVTREEAEQELAGEEHSWKLLRGLHTSPSATLTVVTDPADAVVYIAGAKEKSALDRSGTAPLLAAGIDQHVTVVRAGFKDLELTVRLGKGEKRELLLHLEHLEPAPDAPAAPAAR